MAEGRKQAIGRAAKARIKRGSATPIRGMIARLWGRFTVVGIVTALAAALWAFYVSDELQAKVCTIPLIQPSLSDACGSLGVGGRPDRGERLAWQQVIQRPGDCAALSAHVAKFPEGAYRQRARDLLEARRVSPQGPWQSNGSMIDIYQPRGSEALASEAAARQAALANGNRLAERECRKQSALLQARFVSATATPEDWACDAIGGGTVCGFHGHAACQIETPVERCGAAQ